MRDGFGRRSLNGMKFRLIALILVLLLLAGGIGGYWLWQETRPQSKLGSPTEEYVAPADPGEMLGPPVPREPSRPGENENENEIPWRTYGFDPERTHFAAGMKLRPPFKRLWTVGLGEYIEFPAVVAGRKVFVTHVKGTVHAFHAETGKLLWQRRYPNCAAASPTVADGVVYQAFIPSPCPHGPRDAPGLIVAIDAASGEELWRYAGAPTESSLLLIGRLLYFGGWDGKVYALDIKTQKVRWATETDAEIDSSAAFANGTVYIGTNGGSVYALDDRTGAVRWRSQSYSHFPRGREYFYATPTLAYGRVFIGNTDGTLYAFGARTGNLLWAQQAGPYVYSAAAVWNETVYVGSYDGKMYAFDAATGRLRWTADSPGSIHGAPTVMDGLVYFSVCGNCGRKGVRGTKQGRPGTFAISAETGRLVWRIFDGRYSPIVADGERVYLMGKARVWGLEPCPPKRSRAGGPFVGARKRC